MRTYSCFLYIRSRFANLFVDLHICLHSLKRTEQKSKPIPILLRRELKAYTLRAGLATECQWGGNCFMAYTLRAVSPSTEEVMLQMESLGFSGQ